MLFDLKNDSGKTDDLALKPVYVGELGRRRAVLLDRRIQMAYRPFQ